MWGEREDFKGCYLNVPTFATQCDLSLTAVESALGIYMEAFGEEPHCIMYSATDISTASGLRYGQYGLGDAIPFWIPIPTMRSGVFILTGPKGFFMSQGA